MAIGFLFGYLAFLDDIKTLPDRSPIPEMYGVSIVTKNFFNVYFFKLVQTGTVEKKYLWKNAEISSKSFWKNV